uniref:Uncharacterized protein n=1 Tax=Arundo donax TaxID=35708 RepID=A0A0A9BUR3_ARUDO
MACRIYATGFPPPPAGRWRWIRPISTGSRRPPPNSSPGIIDVAALTPAQILFTTTPIIDVAALEPPPRHVHWIRPTHPSQRHRSARR